ncbi:MAG: hypothetical protein Q8P67_22020 [archaeon]|nr:hypothetical protein [archaeon]
MELVVGFEKLILNIFFFKKIIEKIKKKMKKRKEKKEKRKTNKASAEYGAATRTSILVLQTTESVEQSKNSPVVEESMARGSHPTAERRSPLRGRRRRGERGLDQPVWR